MREIKVSVILPVFNPGDGIHKCIDSLIRQTLREIEMIFVDDCGTDGAKEIILEAAASDTRIRLIENPDNMGAGRSRNNGIEEARGEYLSFVDPDDYISFDFLEQLYKKAVQTGADIVKCVYKNVNEDGTSEPEDDQFNLNQRINEGLQRGYPLYSLFTFQHQDGIYRREMILENDVRYASSNISEDTVFLLKACYAAKSFAFAEGGSYYYVVREGSAVRSFSIKRWKGEMISLHDMLQFIEKEHVFTPEGFRYAINHIVPVLDLLKYFEDTQQECGTMQESLRAELESLSYIDEIMDIDVVIDAFLRMETNLSPIPYGWQWRQVPYREYMERVTTWVEFLGSHPEHAEKSKIYLWRVFEEAIVYDGWKYETEYKKSTALKELRNLGHQLPDKRILTDGFISMKLLINYGIDTFSMRKTRFGETVQALAAKARKSR